MSLSEANCIIARKGDSLAEAALASFIHALRDSELLALARLVTKDGRPPLLVMLAPSVEEDIECLVDVQVPFAEDVRNYTFAPLDRVITMKGKVLTKHRNIPTEEQDQAMSDLVDSMDLRKLGYHAT
jgi:ATP-dependent DNA helicase 2 subunit 2